VHAFDHQLVLRAAPVLKPGGTLVLCEYSVPPRAPMSRAQQKIFDCVVERSVMRPAVVRPRRAPAIVDQAGFEASAPMTSPSGCADAPPAGADLLSPGPGGRAPGVPGVLLNCTAAVESQRHGDG
jgi:hypothetical protein